MITVKVNGQSLPIDTKTIKTMGELVEYVKANIDPDTLITAIQMGGKNLVESDWRVPLSVHGDAVLEIRSASKEEFMRERLAVAPQYIGQILAEFKSARELLKKGEQTPGYTELAVAVRDLNAFFGWYDVLLQANPVVAASFRNDISPMLGDLTKVCEKIVQFQLHNSWLALAESLEQEVEPILKTLEEKFIKLA